MGIKLDESGNAAKEWTRGRGRSDSALPTKRCPIALANHEYPRANCMGSRCALWETDKTQRRKGQGLGRCALGGDVFKDPCG